MSTAGKVLVALVVLTTVAWILLASMAAQLNRNWGEKLQTLTAQVQDLEDQVVKGRQEVTALRTAITQEQVGRIRDERVNQAALEDDRGLLAQVTEDLERLKNQLADAQAYLAGAQDDLERRKTTLAETNQLLTDTRAEVERLKEVDAKLLDRLQGLRKQFLATTQESRQLIEKIRQSSAGRRTRPASLVR